MIVYDNIDGGKEAITNYKVIERFGYVTLISCKLETGRTHQIRVHLSHLGFPIIGDPLYGRKRRFAKSTDSKLREVIEQFPRQALHASSLGFLHPSTNKKIEFTIELPKDIKNLEAKLAQLS